MGNAGSAPQQSDGTKIVDICIFGRIRWWPFAKKTNDSHPVRVHMVS
jgi:hypothetical protein